MRRFMIGPLVWGSLISVYIMLNAAGLMAFLTAYRCNGDQLADTFSHFSNHYYKAWTGESMVESATVDSANCDAADPTLCEVDVPVCASGYEVDSDVQRHALTILAYGLWIFGTVFLVCLLCNYGRIQLAISLNKVAARLPRRTPWRRRGQNAPLRKKSKRPRISHACTMCSRRSSGSRGF